ncbi:MAG TPA: tetratricopeptide repeat protein [Candidatus Sabulitectum sp.]|nr:tetratricopeptide repeat protein [Candidatus Sabulitectum sp.]HPJ28160.1 tetratricopeptide repeat protein [Candidatus Sabulitectum sp.]HPR21826.1 tetratricopeptide repeat protein [Candidatus Sabulitectum sp.]
MRISETFRRTAGSGAILAMAAVLYSMTPVHNGNFFWHLRNGIDIVETGEIRTADPFTWTMHGALWIQHEWLAESAMALAWIHGGEAGPVVLKALFIGLSVLLAFRASLREGGDPSFAFIFGAAWLALAQPRWIARPHFFSIFFFSAFLYVLSLKIRSPWKLTLILLPVQILWVNVHAGFVMGVFLASVPAMEALFSGRGRDFLRWTIPPLAMLAASGIHPNGFRTLEYLPAFLAMPLYKETIREWWSPFDPRYAPLKAISRTAILFTGLTLSTAAAVAFFRKDLRRGRIAALAMLTAATVFAARNGELLAPAMLAWIPGMTRIRLPWKVALIPAVFIFAVPFIYGIPREVGPPRQLGAGVDWEVYPVGAADFLHRNSCLTENAVLFNSNEISGYLEYSFGEELPLFMDGRCLIFPEDFYMDYLRLSFATESDYIAGQYRLFQEYGFNLIVCNTPEEGSSAFLAAGHPGWVPLYFDHLTVVYGSRDLLEESGCHDLGYRYYDPLDPEEFLATPLYLIPADAMEEMETHIETTGTDALNSRIHALRFRSGEELPDSTGFPDDPSGYTLRCWQSCRDGDMNGAVEYASLSGDPNLAAAVGVLSGVPFDEYQSLLGISSRGMIRTEWAERAVQITALWVTGQQSEALGTAEACLDSLPGWGIAQCGMLYSLAGDRERALELAELALETRRGPVVLERVARIQSQEGNPETAADLCREALALSPDFAGARLLLGNCLWETGMVTEAAIEYETIVLSGLELPEYALSRLELAERLTGTAQR